MKTCISIDPNPGAPQKSELFLEINPNDGFNSPAPFNLVVDNSYQLLTLRLRSIDVIKLRDFLNQIDFM